MNIKYHFVYNAMIPSKYNNINEGNMLVWKPVRKVLSTLEI